MTKPIVQYDTFMPFQIEVGKSAMVFPLNHPSPLVSNQKFIRTSEVMYYSRGTGIFETQNTRYVPDRCITERTFKEENDGMSSDMIVVEDHV